MIKVFIDTNIIIDLIADRKPFSKFAVEIFKKAESKKIKLFSSSHSFATIHFLLKKHIEEKQLNSILHDLLDYVQIIPVDQNIIKKSLKSKYKNFEEAIQVICAYSIANMDCIVTRNIKDFREAEISVFTPEEFLRGIEG